jgi:nitrogen PTS system EIIA component
MTSDLSALLAGGVVLPSSEAADRPGAIRLLCRALAATTRIPADVIEAAVMEREALGSTGVGEGVAIPHARLEALAMPIGGFVRLVTGVDFGAIDERECDLIFMLLAPARDGAEHLRALARVSRVFRQSAVRDALRDAVTVAEIRALIAPEAVTG